jgi:hypothetical protein
MAPTNSRIQMIGGLAGRQEDVLPGQHVGARKGLGIVQRTGVEDDSRNAKHEAEVPDAVDHEGLEVGKDGSRSLVPEPDQQVGNQPDRLPAEEQLQEVVGHHQHQHREREQRDVGEETLVARVIAHVANGVDVDHQRDEGHDRHHQRSQVVHQEADFHPHAVADGPGIDSAVVRLQFAGNQQAQHPGGQEE